MSSARALPLWSLVLEQAAGQAVTVGHICAAAVAAVGVDGVAVVLATRPTLRETVYTGDQLAIRIEELTITLGEGPGVDAITGGGPVLAGDLTGAESSSRWPVFAPAATALGTRALFVLPLRIGAIRIGILSLHRGRAGPLTSAQVSAALAMADFACLLLIERAGHLTRPPAEQAEAPHDGMQHPEVHQATGMVAVQLETNTEVAFVRLRAHAYTHNRRLRDVARDVVARRLRFEPEPSGD